MPKHTLVLEDLFPNESGRLQKCYAFALIVLVLLHFLLFFLNFCFATSLLAFIVKHLFIFRFDYLELSMIWSSLGGAIFLVANPLNMYSVDVSVRAFIIELKSAYLTRL